VQLKPDSLEAHDKLGLIYVQQARLGEAIAQFQEALRIKQNDPIAQESLARAKAALTRTH